jgi:hypothetical protein
MMLLRKGAADGGASGGINLKADKMKNAHSNPLMKPFSNMLAEDGKYLAEHVDTFWNIERKDGNLLVKDVETVFAPKERTKHPDLLNQYWNYYKRWSCDLGNSCDGWMEGELTPAIIFGDMLRSGFLNQNELVSALKEFSHIVECNWAREMLSGFEDRE